MIRLNIKKLVDDEVIDKTIAQKLIAHADKPLWIPILQAIGVIFGSIMITLAVVMLFASPIIGLVLSASIIAISYFLFKKDDYKFIARSMQTLGVLGLIGSIFWYIDVADFEPTQIGSIVVFGLVTIILAISAWTQNNKFLAGLAPISFGYMFGMSTYYWHASYALVVENPLVTVLIFGVITVLGLFLEKRVVQPKSELIVIATRVAFFMMQFGFWVGSLWGGETSIPSEVFAVLWLIELVALIIWSAKNDNGYLRVTAIVFLCIHFYTQLFEYFAHNAAVMLLAGLSIFGLAIFSSVWLAKYANKTPELE